MPGKAPATSAAIETIGGAVADDVYLFIDDDADHFVGEAFLLGFAGALLQSFAKGFVGRARQRTEGWGSEMADFLADRVDGLVRRGRHGSASDPVAEAEPDIAEARKIAAASAESQVDAYAAASEAALVALLQERQLTPREAARVAAVVRDAAMNAIHAG